MSGPAHVSADLYDRPLYYDIIFDEDTEEEASFLEAVWREHGRGTLQRILEPACGTARLVAALSRRGYHVVGFDRNEAMLAFGSQRLREGGLPALLQSAAMESFTLRGTFQLAFCLVSTFKYLLREKDAVAHLRRIADHLRPGGLYVLGFHLTDYSRKRPTHERWVATRDQVKVVCNTRTFPADRRRRRELIRNRLTVHLPSSDLRRYESHWDFRTYDAAQTRRLLGRIPAFELVACYDFGYDLHNPRALDDKQEDIVLVLRRRPNESHHSLRTL